MTDAEREYRLKKKYQHKYTANQKASRAWWNKCWTEKLEKRKEEAKRKEQQSEGKSQKETDAEAMPFLRQYEHKSR
jgi:hypothetical protein